MYGYFFFFYTWRLKMMTEDYAAGHFLLTFMAKLKNIIPFLWATSTLDCVSVGDEHLISPQAKKNFSEW